ncbi:hypothetical protein V6N13_111218 [Hibiscus sabdariffa]
MLVKGSSLMQQPSLQACFWRWTKLRFCISYKVATQPQGNSSRVSTDPTYILHWYPCHVYTSSPPHVFKAAYCRAEKSRSRVVSTERTILSPFTKEYRVLSTLCGIRLFLEGCSSLNAPIPILVSWFLCLLNFGDAYLCLLEALEHGFHHVILDVDNLDVMWILRNDVKKVGHCAIMWHLLELSKRN